jgi:hypothetical protein
MWQSLLGRTKRKITFISTYHNSKMITIPEDGKETIKPKMAVDYNTSMVVSI